MWPVQDRGSESSNNWLSKVVSLQLIKINEKKKKTGLESHSQLRAGLPLQTALPNTLHAPSRCPALMSSSAQSTQPCYSPSWEVLLLSVLLGFFHRSSLLLTSHPHSWRLSLKLAHALLKINTQYVYWWSPKMFWGEIVRPSNLGWSHSFLAWLPAPDFPFIKEEMTWSSPKSWS